MEKAVKETGFPSPAQGYESKSIDFNRLLITNPAATFIMAAEVPMPEKGILPGSLLVVDRSVRPKAGSLVILCHEGEFICREMVRTGKNIVFTDGYNEINPSQSLIEVFGTVSGVVTRL